MNPVQIKLFGSFVFLVGDAPVRFPSRKAESLLAYLVLNEDRPLTRDRLANILWPDVDESRARRNLSTTLWRVKTTLRSAQALGLDLEAERAHVSLHCEGVEVDVIQFRSLLESTTGSTGARRRQILQEAEALYRGDLLEGHADEWCEEERRYLRARCVGLLKQLVQTGKESGDYERGIAYARKASALDPLDEENHRDQMILYHLSGNHAAALAQYEMLRRLLQGELGVQPAKPTTELWQYIRSHEKSLPPSLSQRLTTSDGLVPSDRYSELPMVGREQHLTTIVQLLGQAAQGNGSAVIVSGEAGIGKTKLVDAVAVEARLRGFEVLQGRCPDLQDPPPYQVFIHAVWPRIPALERLAGGSPSPVAQLIRELAPDAFPRHRGSSYSSSPSLLNSAIITEALLRLLDRGEGAPTTVLILEDIHRIDTASLTLLASLLARLTKLRLLVLVTVRTGAGRADEILSMFIRSGVLDMPLKPLSDSETIKLVQAILRSKNVSSSVVRLVWEHTGGTPLFVLEFMKFLLAEGHLVKDTLGHWSLSESVYHIEALVPARVHEAIRKRIDLLDRQSRSILCAAAVLGVETDFGHLRALTAVSEEELVESTDRLVDAQLLGETEHGFKFAHETTRLVALTMLTKAKRRLLHQKAGRLLEDSAPGRTEDLYVHFREAGDAGKALVYAEASGDRARAVYANHDAAAWYSRALQILTTDSSKGRDQLPKRAELLIKRHESLDLLGDRSAQMSDINAIHAVAEELGDRALLARALYLRASLLARINSFEAGLDSARQAAHLFQELGDMRGEAATAATLGQLYLYMRNHRLAQQELQRTVRLFQQLGDGVGEARVRVDLASILAWKDTVEGMKCLARAEALLRNGSDRRTYALVLFQKGLFFRLLGKLTLSESCLLAGLELMAVLGDRVGRGRGLSQLAMTHAIMGRLRDAVHEGRQAVRIARESKDVRALLSALNNVGYGVYRLAGDFRRAEQCVAEVMQLVADAGGREDKTLYADTMVAIHLDRGATHAALHWAKDSEVLALAGSQPSVLYEVQLHLGVAYLQAGQHARALRALRKAFLGFEETHDLTEQILAAALLAEAYLASGDQNSAIWYVEDCARVLRRIDAVERIQQVYWTQFRVYNAAGARAPARRALRQAYAAVMQQASTLKGRMRRRFLTEVNVNREILEEVQRLWGSRFQELAGSVQQVSVPRAVEAGGRLSPGSVEVRILSVLAQQGDASRRVAQRRDVIIQLLHSSNDSIRVTQKVLALKLGVSARTVRHDIAALRSQGLLSATSRNR